MIKNNVIVPYSFMRKGQQSERRNAPSGYEDFNVDWFLSPKGNMLYVWFDYEILYSQLEDQNTILHLMEKDWFDANTFIPAYFEACRRKGIQQLKIKTIF